MDLRGVLSEVESFCQVLPLGQLLSKVKLAQGIETEEEAIRTFCADTLVLVETEITLPSKEKKNVSFSEFMQAFESLLGSKKVHINDFVCDRYEDFPLNHIQRKDITNNETKAFLYCLKYLVNQNMEWLLGKLGDEALYFLLLNSIILIKVSNQYWQISGKSLELYFEDLKKGPKGDIQLVPHNEPYSKLKEKEKLPVKDLQKGPKIREYFKEYVNRNHMLYCLHSNGKPTLFHKNRLTALSKRAKELCQFKEPERSLCLQDLGRELRQTIFTEKEPRLSLQPKFDKAASEWLLAFGKTDIERIYKRTCPIDPSFFPLKNEIKKFIKLKECDDKKISEFISRLVKLDTPLEGVTRFMLVLLRQSFPESLLGKLNKDILLGYAIECVKMKKYELLSFKEVYKKLSFDSIPWLAKVRHSREKPAVIAENNLLLRQVLYFFFNKIVIELIRANFYASEKHNEHNKIFFYCKPVWYLITQTSMVNLETLNIEKIKLDEDAKADRKVQAAQSLRAKDFLENNPCAKLRLVPKSDSVRPIMTFYKKFRDPKSTKFVKVGAYLKNAKIVLRGWRRILGEQLGYAVFDNYQIFDKYAAFKKDWETQSRPPIFYSTMDIQKCYDSVDLDILFELLRKENLFKNFYLISEFYKVMRNRRYAFRMKKDLSQGDKFKMSSLFIFKQRNSAVPLKEARDINSIIQDEPLKEGFTIFLDRPRKRLVSKEDLMESIKFVCYQVRIRFGNQIYRLKKGLPQGLSISSVLSSFYYAVLEQKALNSIYDGKRLGSHELVLRLTDDYLIMSEDQSVLKLILEKLLDCANNNHFTFNQKKLTTNFRFRDYDPAGREASCKWIGKVIDLHSLEMEHVQSLDYRTLFYTISTNINYLDKFPAQIIKSKLKSFILNHNLFYIDTRVNSWPKIKEILRKTIVCAYLKLRTYLDKVLGNTPCGHEKMIALKIVESLIDCAIAVYKISDPQGYELDINNQLTKEIFDLFLATFMICLHQDQTSKGKRQLHFILRTQIKEANFDYWINHKSDTLKIIF